jgi:formate dehydrogenase major subunit
MVATKSLLNTPADHSPNTELTIDGIQVPGHSGELLIDLLNSRTAVGVQKPVPQVCYVPQMGPIQSCDTCVCDEGCRRNEGRDCR